MKKSNLFKIDTNDLLKGAIVSALVVVLSGVSNSLEAGTDILSVGFVKSQLSLGVLAFVGYLTKNLLSNSEDKFLKKEVK